jgi:hypothetical protein
MQIGSDRKPTSAASWLRDQSVHWTRKRGCASRQTGSSWRSPPKKDGEVLAASGLSKTASVGGLFHFPLAFSPSSISWRMAAASGREWLFVIRRAAANRAVKAAAEFGRDNVKTNGSEIDTDVLIAIVVCLTIRLRKFGATRPTAFRASERFGPPIASGHFANMRRKQAGSSQYPCHKQTDPLPVFGVRVGHLPPSAIF